MKTPFFALAFVFATSAADAMPPFHAQANVMVPVASGCGLGVHRGRTMGATQSMVITPVMIAATATTTTPVLLVAECAADAARISRAISLEHVG